MRAITPLYSARAGAQLAPCVIPTLIPALIESARCMVVLAVVLRLRKRRESDRERERERKTERKRRIRRGENDERKTKAEDVKLYRQVKDDQVLDVHCDVE